MNFGDRWDSHRALLRANKHGNRHLQNAWNKYGEDSFKFEIVELIEDDDTKRLLEKLNEREIYYIDKYRKLNRCYNILAGGDGGNLLGGHLSDEAKRKIGEKNRQNMLGKKMTEETKKKMSESQKRRWANMTEQERKDYGAMLSEKASGYKLSDDFRQKMSLIQREHPHGARFTADNIRDMRRKREDGMKIKDIAKEYDTTPSVVSSIIHRRRWAYI